MEAEISLLMANQTLVSIASLLSLRHPLDDDAPHDTGLARKIDL